MNRCDLAKSLVFASLLASACSPHAPTEPCVCPQAPPTASQHEAPPVVVPSELNGGLRLEYELSDLSYSEESKITTRTTASAIARILEQVGVTNARVYQLNLREIVIDLPGGLTEEKMRRLREAITNAKLPQRLTFTRESIFRLVKPSP